MPKLYSRLAFFFLFLITSPVIIAQNLGYEATPATSPPANWTAVSGTWSVNTNPTYVRTGVQSMFIVDPATTGSTMGTTTPVLTTTAPGYLITIGWGKANVPSNGVLYLGYRSGTTNTLNPTATATGQPANLNDVTWSRITSVSASSTLAAGSYGISMRAFRTAASPSTTVYIDDVIIYPSTSNVPDLSAPNAATGASIVGNQLSWTNGTDNGTPASGIGGVVIVRANGPALPAPTLNDQAMYDPVNGAAGVGSFVQNGITWTVVANISGSSTTTFTDASSTGGPYTYAIFMRDLAYNYSPATLTGATTACTVPPTAGTTTSSVSTMVCSGTTVNIALTGNSLGAGQTYQLQSSATQSGTYTNVGTALNFPFFTVNPTTTTWYQVAVTCSGNTQTSIPVQVLINSGLSGAYTINSALATGGTNFQTFADAIGALSCGITGPVTFNVTGGPYNEQVIIPVVTGSSAVNTITFNGNGSTITYTSTNTAERAVVKLNGSDYVTFNNFIINATGSATTEYGYGVQITNDADNNTISNNTITATSTPTTAASTAFAGVVIGLGTTSAIGTGNSLSDNNMISGNTITGGYAGVSVVANSGTNVINDNKVVNNIVREFYQYGIHLNGNNNALVEGNDISRPTRTSVSNFYGINLETINTNTRVSKNKMHDPFGGSPTNTNAAYGVRMSTSDATVGNENIISNNFIYSFIGGTGVQNGILNNSSDNAKIYFNSILINDLAATCNCAARGIYVQTTTVAGLDIRDNNIVVGRGGSGEKQAIYFEPTSVTAYTLDYNNYYMLTGGTGAIEVANMGPTGYATLALWQAASGKDANSLSVDPLYTSSSDLHLQAGSPVDNQGTPITGITTDIDNDVRSVGTPEIGADELPAAVGLDVGTVSLVNPVVKVCYSNAETVTVKIANNSASTINFASNPVTLTVNVTGATTATLNLVINTGTLASLATLDVTLPTTLNMLAVGTYTFNANVSLAGDINPANDAMTAETRTVSAVDAGTVAASDSTFCLTGTPVLTITGNAGGNIQWQQATVSAGPWTNVGTGGTTFTPAAAITTTTYYRAIVSCGTISDTSNIDSVIVNNPQLLSTTPGVRCGSGTVNLGATSSAGTTINWYDAATAGNLVGTGGTFTTPVLSTTTTYYVSASSGIASQFVGAAGISSFPNSGTNASFTAGQLFDVLSGSVTIQSVDIYPTTAIGTNFQIVVRSGGGTGTVIATYQGTTTVTGTVAAPVVQTVPVNFTIPQGTGYAMTFFNGTLQPPLTGTAVYPGGLRNNPATGVTYPYTLPGLISITNGTAANTWYYFYNWSIGSGCETPRTAVTATVSSSAPLTLTANTTVCNNATTQLSVTSNLSDYNSYVWSPVTNLYTNAAATTPYTGGSATTVYAKIATGGVHTYTVNANNSATLCANVDSVKLTVLPSPITVNASNSNLCVTGSSTMSLSPATGYGTATFQWFSSPNGTTYTPIAGATGTTYTTPTLTSTTYYNVEIKDAAGNTCVQPADTINVNNPQVLTTTPATRCGPGTVSLGATGNPGATFNWYAAATGGTPIGTGAPFVTPVINNTTTFYVAASTGGSSNVNVGLPNELAGTSGAGLANFGLVFDALVPFTLNTVTIYPVGAAGTTGTVTIDVIDGNNNVLHTAVVNVVANPATAPVAQTVPLNFNILPGTNLKLRPSARSTGITGLLFEPSASAPPGGNYGYPFVIPGVLSINTSTLTAAPTNTPRNDLYYYFYNWSVSTGCESPRQAVVATVNTAPAFNITDSLTVCNNAITQLQVNTPLANFNTYEWTPAAGLFTNAAATTPYTAGTSASTVYARIATPGTYTFIAQANNTTTTCQNFDTVKVTVLPASITVVPSPDALCVSGTSTLTILPNPSTFGQAQYQWQSSSNNTVYTNIPGATNPSYTTPTISATTYYRVDLKNSAGVSCTTAYDTIIVNAPAILSTTPAALCGTGSMTLSATATAGSTINWYNATGTLLGTGASFTTPNLTQTTTYFAAALNGGGGVDVGIKINEFPICGTPVTTATANWSLRFTTTKAVVINTAYLIPQSTTPVKIDLYAVPAAGIISTITLPAFTAAQVSAGTPVQVPIGFSIGTPGNYQLVISQGGSGRITTLACGYPFSTPGGGFSITGSATSSTAAPVTTSYNTFFHLNVTEGCESPKVPVVAQVSANTAITQQPTNISTCVGASINLVVGATGANLVFQWRKNGVVIANSNNDTLTLNPVAITDAGTYDVVITGLCGSPLTSTTITVNVSAGNTWLGTVSADWNNPLNWCGGVPTPTSDVTIFPGTPYQPIVNATLADVRTLTISTGASVILMPNATMSIYGDFINNGTFSAANAFVFFKGTTPQNINGMTVGNALVNGAGITLSGTMTVNQTFTLTNGNVTLGINNLSVNGNITGSINSHVVTNSTGSVISRNITTTPVTVPVGPSATSYNPVTLNNGSGRDYSVRVSTGVSPTINNPGRAVNRTWNIVPNIAPGAPVNITFQYEDTHMNTPGVATNTMEIGVHNGSLWTVVAPSVNPSGTPTSRQVAGNINQFGPMVVANVGGISWITSTLPVDLTISSAKLLPNLVENSAVLRVISTRSAKIRWQVYDEQGRVVMSFDNSVMPGQNDMQLQFGRLASGMYTLTGFTGKGAPTIVRFVKQ